MKYIPNSAPGTFDHRAITCATCSPDSPLPFFRPYKSCDPFKCTACGAPERGEFPAVVTEAPACLRCERLSAELAAARLVHAEELGRAVAVTAEAMAERDRAADVVEHARAVAGALDKGIAIVPECIGHQGLRAALQALGHVAAKEPTA